jgi:hypothetical protein
VLIGLKFYLRKLSNAGMTVSIEPFFVPLEVLATFFGSTGHTRVFMGSFVQNIN